MRQFKNLRKMDIFEKKLNFEMGISFKKLILVRLDFENIQYCKIYFYYGLSLTKTSYNDSAHFFKRYSHFKISIFFKNVYFSQVYKIAA